MTAEGTDATFELRRLLDGFLTTQLLYVAAELGVADVLASGPMRGTDVAAATGADPDTLVRVLRGLVVEGVLDEDEAGRYSLTAVGACLPSLLGAAIVRGDLYYRSAAGLLHAVRTGETAFDHVYGAPFFDHLDEHPEHDAAFQRSMAVRAEREARDLLAAHDFSDVRRLVDVGGGPGVALAAILRAAPDLAGVLLDRAPMIPVARERLAAEGVGDRAECIAADFFDSIPSGGDAYLLSRVLHDWNDEDAIRILGTCRRAMAPESRLLIFEMILPERARDLPDAIRMDLHMLLLLGARERTEAEFRRLLHQGGFAVDGVTRTASPAGLGVIDARPA